MMIRFREGAKPIGISMIAFCAVFVCTLFLNFYTDLSAVDRQMLTDASAVFYDAQLSTAKVVAAISGGCLLATSAVLLIFYVRDSVESRKREIGLMKAFGYGNLRIAVNFSVFGISVLMGALPGFGASFLLMPEFYEVQNKDGFLPDIGIAFHPSLLFLLVILPTLFFSLLSILCALRRLRCSPLSMLCDRDTRPSRARKHQKEKNRPFLKEMRSAVLRSRKAMAFLMGFAAFCFSSMMQMSASMDELASPLAGVMILVIGLTLAFTALILSAVTVLKKCEKDIAMMSLFGYTPAECRHAVLNGYRPIACGGFVIGTVYQYALLRIMVDVVFREIENVPTYSFDWTAFFLTVLCFIPLYEGLIALAARRIRKIPIKSVMMEG